MKQVVQNYRTGRMTVEQVPRPAPLRGEVLVRTVCSLISAGTERTRIQLARKSLLGKARERPDLVRKALQKAKTDGLVATIRSTLARLDEWAPLGYSCAGQVVAVGEGAGGFQVGDPVACAGAAYASHAEVVSVPKHLVARTPAGVSHEEAAFVTLGAIAMQGIRQAGIVVGERVAVIGLGLIGQLACQLVTAAGAAAFGIDVDPHRVELARALGAAETVVGGVCPAGADYERRCRRRVLAPGAGTRDGDIPPTDIARWAETCTGGVGFDAVIIAAGGAAASNRRFAAASSDPVRLAGEIARDRAIVVAVGAVGMDVPRRTYYQKELTFKLSRSYGPGRYDPTYEQKGIDYPIGYVRWTENRNMDAFLALVAAGKLDVRRLVTHRFGIDQALEAYGLVTGERAEPHLTRGDSGPAAPGGPPQLSLIGAGRFARGVLLPALKKAGCGSLRGVSSARGLSARQAADRFGFAYCTSDASDILTDDATDAVLIATPHNLHARMVCDALSAGKHVFVEKPLCLNDQELEQVSEAVHAHPGLVLMVGFNRRFSPLTTWLKEQLIDAGPLVMDYRVQAGPPPRDHWATDRAIGGGRMIGEVCHFVDWMVSLCRFLPTAVTARPIPDGADGAVITIDFQNGSVGTISYVASDAAGVPKERIEVLGGGRAAEINNWRTARLWHQGRSRRRKKLSQKKGHLEEIQAFIQAIRQDAVSPTPFAEIEAVTRATFAIEESLRTGAGVALTPAPVAAPAFVESTR
jgi:polar amino acid transport system substrate-binding protein